MNAVVLAVGAEMLGPGRRDTNAEWLIPRLFDLGIETSWRAVVDDDVARIAQLTRAAWSRPGLILITGGLGPTDDDRTREAVARALDVPLVRDPEMERRIIARFESLGRVAGPRQALQADRPEGAEWIDNPLGSAPGFWITRDGRSLGVLPGVPAEMKAMFLAFLAPRLSARGPGAVVRATLRIAGRPESYVDDRVRDLYGTKDTSTTILASAGVVELIVSARGADDTEAQSRLEQLAEQMRDRLGKDVFGERDDTLASVVGSQLAARGATVATAESCTGGLLAGALTDVAGSSAWFRGGLVCYANDLKTQLAGVSDEILRAHGAVSEETARAMAAGARARCGADFGLGVTGVAGPGGGTAEKPVGTVHIALDDGERPGSIKLDWPGDRELIRRRAVAASLDLLRRRLIG